MSDGYVVWSEIDGSLTSCIALSFLYDGLIDARLIPERSPYTLGAMLLSYLLIIASYIFNVCCSRIRLLRHVKLTAATTSCSACSFCTLT